MARIYIQVARVAPELTVLECTVNGRPGLVAQVDGVTVTVWAVRNPEKLRPWTAGVSG